jgi:hypothetical protein
MIKDGCQDQTTLFGLSDRSKMGVRLTALQLHNKGTILCRIKAVPIHS